MKIINSADVPTQPVTEEGAHAATVRWLLAQPEGAPTFAMRLFELQPGGCTPLHQHAWEHEIFVLEGSLELVSPTGPLPLSPGDAVLVLPDEQHQFRNTGRDAARMLCLIPLPGKCQG